MLEELLNTNGYNKIEMKAMFGHVSSDPTVTGFSDKFHKSIMTLNDEIVNGKPLLEFFPQFSRAKTANIHTYTFSTKGYVPNDLYVPFADKLESTLVELHTLGHSYDGIVIGGKAFDDNLIQVLKDAEEFGVPWTNDSGNRFLSTSTSDEVAEHFIKMSEDEIVSGAKKAVKLEIVSKKGIYVDDISRYGTNLLEGAPNNTGPVQLEVLMNRTAEYNVVNYFPETMFLDDGTEIEVLRFILEEI